MGFCPGQIRTKTTKLVSAASLLSMLHKGVKTKTGWPGIRIMWLSTVACLASKSKDWLAWNQDNVAEYSGMSNE